MNFTARVVLLFLSLFSAVYEINAQSKKAFDVDELELNWHFIANDFEHSGQCKAAFTLINRAKMPFPASGWTIYFTSSQEINSANTSGAVKIEHLNGDLFVLKPTAEFKAIPAKDSLRIEYFTNGTLINYSACPTGPYLVWDSQPEKGQPILKYRVAPLKNTVEGIVTPARVFARNLQIKNLSEAQLPKIFPTPVQYSETGGTLALNSKISILADPIFENEARYLAQALEKMFGQKISREPNPQLLPIRLQKTDLQGEEAYQLSVEKTGVNLSASTAAGIFYGIQSLWSLMPPQAWKQEVQTAFTIPTLTVQDAPRFGYRSLMLDVARNFKSQKDILRVLDLMALYKMNVLHFHFSDDEGWRIEIPGLPELTNVGAQRGHTTNDKTHLMPSYAAGPETGKTLGSGYYSRAEFVEILRYANQRHIQIIPEIESPGHSRAAIKAMDARFETWMKQGNTQEAQKYLLRDLGDQSVYSSAQLWTDNVMCVALPSVYTFLDKVVDELALMYREAGAPLTTIHMGGDEVPAGVWEKSPACHQLIGTDPNLENTDDLWYYYYGRVYELLKSKGLFLSAWEEAGMRKTRLDGAKTLIVNSFFAKNQFQLHVWNNVTGWGAEDLPYKLANAGYKVVLSPVSNNYLDLAYIKHPDEPGYYWGGFQDLDKPFYFIPFDYYKTSVEDPRGNPVDPAIFQCKERLTDFGKSNIVGIQGLLWAENLRSVELMEYMLLPKLLGVAERAWAKEPDWALEKDEARFQQLYRDAWSQFVHVIGKRELPRLDYFANGFQYRIPWPGARVENGVVEANIQLPGFTIRYTTDGSEPNSASPVYESPIAQKGVIKLKAFNSKGRASLSTVIENK